MFVSDKIVYLQMHKAASTHVTRVLQKDGNGHINVSIKSLLKCFKSADWSEAYR